MKHYAYNSPFKMKDKDGIEYTLTLKQDYDAENPREWDNVCTMICWNRSYRLGDRHSFNNPDEFMQHLYLDVTGKHWCDEHDDDYWKDIYEELLATDLVLIKPIRAYEHSGIALSTSDSYPFNDRWDSYFAGFIFVTKETIFKECSGITEENWKERADEYIEGEIETYNQYFSGEIYGYILTKKETQQEKCPHCGEVLSECEEDVEVQSCWGFYGDVLEDNGILYQLDDLEFVERCVK